MEITIEIQTIQRQESGKSLSQEGRIKIKKRGWLIRISAIIVLTFVIWYNVQQGMELNDPLIVYSTLMPAHALFILAIGWFLYKIQPKEKWVMILFL